MAQADPVRRSAGRSEWTSDAEYGEPPLFLSIPAGVFGFRGAAVRDRPCCARRRPGTPCARCPAAARTGGADPRRQGHRGADRTTQPEPGGDGKRPASVELCLDTYSSLPSRAALRKFTPARCCVEVSDAWKHLQIGLGKERRHILRVMHRDGAVRVAVPELDWALNRRVLQSGRSRHESQVFDQPVRAVSGGFRKSIADRLIDARFMEECAIYCGNLLLEPP